MKSRVQDPPRPSIWLQPVSLGVSEGMTLAEKKRVHIINGTALWLALLGPAFVYLNIAGGNLPLALVNIASTCVGLLCLLLTWRRHLHLAALLLILGCCTVFSFSGLFFRNGMEYYLLLGMVGTMFMFDAIFERAALVAINAVAFFIVRLQLFHSAGPEPMSIERYGINLLVFLFCNYWILDIFRIVNRNYHKEVEQKNRDLAESRMRLDEEHAKLRGRTRELDVANMAKEKLFSIVAHDLRGPVGNLRGAVGLLGSGDLSPADFNAMLGALKGEVDHAYECLDTLLVWSASQLHLIEPAFAVVSLAAVSEQCVRLLADSAVHKAVCIRNSIPPGAEVWVDENQLAVILRNLLSNAVKFTPAGGLVEISARKGEGVWEVLVSDTGVGMPEEKARQLFQSQNTHLTLGTSNEKGFGLGLQICTEFTRHNKGKLTVESQEGRGSTFYLTLPCPTAPMREEPYPFVNTPLEAD